MSVQAVRQNGGMTELGLPPVANSSRRGVLQTPCLTAVHSCEPAGEQPSTTRQGAIGVAFTPQRRAVSRFGTAPERQHGFGPNSVFLTQGADLVWQAWTATSDALELWFEPAWLTTLSLTDPLRLPDVDAHDDAVVVNIASIFRRAIHGSGLEAMAAEQLALRLLGHLMQRHTSLRLPPGPRALGAVELSRLVALVEDAMAEPLGIGRLSDLLGLSPFHFVRLFRSATGSTPHAFVLARRMERALLLLRGTHLPVIEVAARVGYASSGHFRRHFSRHWGLLPAAARAQR